MSAASASLLESAIAEAVPAGEGREVLLLIARRAPALTSARQIAAHAGVAYSTFLCRFFRARLPSPKALLLHARICHATALLEGRSLSIAAVAARLGYSSPQSFGRHLQATLGMTAGELRARVTGAQAVARYRQTFLDPYREQFAHARLTSVAP